MRSLCRALGKNESYPKISIFKAMKILADSWEAVAKETFINCFKKAGINSDVQQAVIDDSVNPLKDLLKNLNELKLTNPSMLSEDVTAESIVNLDDNVIATAPEIAQSDIMQELCLSQQTEIEEEENDYDDESSIEESLDQSQEKSSRSKVESALHVLSNAALYSDKGDDMQSIIFKLEILFKFFL